MESHTRSKKYRSCETTTSAPGQVSSRSSSTASVSTSRSFVGSSSSNTLGPPSNKRRTCNRRRSPPDRSPTRASSRPPVNPKPSSNDVADIVRPLPTSISRRIASTDSSTRSEPSSSASSCDSRALTTVRPRRSSPAIGSIVPARSDSNVVLPAPLGPSSPTRSPGPSCHVTSLSRILGGSPTAMVTSVSSST